MKLLPGPLKAASIAPIAAVPEYAKLSEEWQVERDELNNLTNELREVEAAIRERDSETQDERAQRVADALRAGDKSGGLTVHSLMVEATRLNELIAGRRIIDGDFRAKAAEMRSELSINAATAIKPAHRDAVGAVVAALAALRAAVDGERAVRQQLIDAGYDALLPAMLLPIDLDAGKVATLGQWEDRAKEYAA